MEQRVARAQYPWWVKLSMMGVPGRGGLWGCVVLCLLLAIGGGYLSLVNAQYWLVTVLALAAAIPYWLTIRWVDRYGSWDGDRAH
jgi:hypothetical protein